MVLGKKHTEESKRVMSEKAKSRGGKKNRNYNHNPTGKGGLGDHPEHINFGGRPKNQESFTYWLNYFKNLSVLEFRDWLKANPEKNRSVAANLAYARMVNSLADLAEFKEVADRTEGKARQPVSGDLDLNLNFNKLESVVDEIINLRGTEDEEK